MRLRDTALMWGALFLLVSAVLFIVGALVDGPGPAWGYLAGSRDPAFKPKPALNYLLAADGYLVLPVAIAVAFAGLVDWRVQSKQLEGGAAENKTAKTLTPTPAMGATSAGSSDAASKANNDTSGASVTPTEQQENPDDTSR
jgi:hypothetical protein